MCSIAFSGSSRNNSSSSGSSSPADVVIVSDKVMFMTAEMSLYLVLFPLDSYHKPDESLIMSLSAVSLSLSCFSTLSYTHPSYHPLLAVSLSLITIIYLLLPLFTLLPLLPLFTLTTIIYHYLLSYYHYLLAFAIFLPLFTCCLSHITVIYLLSHSYYHLLAASPQLSLPSTPYFYFSCLLLLSFFVSMTCLPRLPPLSFYPCPGLLTL